MCVRRREFYPSTYETIIWDFCSCMYVQQHVSAGNSAYGWTTRLALWVIVGQWLFWCGVSRGKAQIFRLFPLHALSLKTHTLEFYKAVNYKADLGGFAWVGVDQSKHWMFRGLMYTRDLWRKVTQIHTSLQYNFIFFTIVILGQKHALHFGTFCNATKNYIVVVKYVL